MQQAFTSMHYTLSICFHTGGGKAEGREEETKTWGENGAFSSSCKVTRSGDAGGREALLNTSGDDVI